MHWVAQISRKYFRRILRAPSDASGAFASSRCQRDKNNVLASMNVFRASTSSSPEDNNIMSRVERYLNRERFAREYTIGSEQLDGHTSRPGLCGNRRNAPNYWVVDARKPPSPPSSLAMISLATAAAADFCVDREACETNMLTFQNSGVGLSAPQHARNYVADDVFSG